MSIVDLIWLLWSADTSIHKYAQPAYCKTARPQENVGIILSCTCICVHAGLQGSLRQLRTWSVSPVLLAPVQPVTNNPWPLESSFVGFYSNFLHVPLGGRQLFNCEIGTLMTHFIHTVLISCLDPKPTLWLSLMGQLLFEARHECADFQHPFLWHTHVDLWHNSFWSLALVWCLQDTLKYWFLHIDVLMGCSILFRHSKSSICLYAFDVLVRICNPFEHLRANCRKVLERIKPHSLFGCTFPQNIQYEVLISSRYTEQIPHHWI